MTSDVFAVVKSSQKKRANRIFSWNRFVEDLNKCVWSTQKCHTLKRIAPPPFKTSLPCVKRNLIKNAPPVKPPFRAIWGGQGGHLDHNVHDSYSPHWRFASRGLWSQKSPKKGRKNCSIYSTLPIFRPVLTMLHSLIERMILHWKCTHNLCLGQHPNQVKSGQMPQCFQRWLSRGLSLSPDTRLDHLRCGRHRRHFLSEDEKCPSQVSPASRLWIS